MCEYFVTRYILTGRSFQHLVQSPKLEDHPLSAVRDCLFNIFAATFHIGGRSSICNLRMRHAVVIGTHLSHDVQCILGDICPVAKWQESEAKHTFTSSAKVKKD